VTLTLGQRDGETKNEASMHGKCTCGTEGLYILRPPLKYHTSAHGRASASGDGAAIGAPSVMVHSCEFPATTDNDQPAVHCGGNVGMVFGSSRLSLRCIDDCAAQGGKRCLAIPSRFWCRSRVLGINVPSMPRLQAHL
jgi:hypothetical protein